MTGITQADRDAAWPFRSDAYRIEREERVKERWNYGDYDEASRVIKAFARHRQSSVADLLKALKICDDAIREMFRYYDGGETRGSYDGKPERDQLRKAGYAASAAIFRAQSTGEPV